MRSSPAVLLMAAAVATLVAGCGGSAHVTGDRTLDVALTEYRVSPQDVQAPAGPILITVHNYGRLTHDLVLERNGETAAQTKPIPPGQSAQLEAALLPGTYTMASTVLADQALGAYGTIDAGS